MLLFNKYTISLLIISLVIGADMLSGNQALYAQNEPVIEFDDSSKYQWEQRVPNYGPDFLKVSDTVGTKVTKVMNAKRLTMLGHQWWGLPTEREALRLEGARYARYGYDYLYPYKKQIFQETGHAYNHNYEILNKQNLTVFAWHPAWQTEAYKTYNFNLITHLSFCSYDVNPVTGGYSNFRSISEFRSTDLLRAAQQDTCKVLLNVRNLGQENNDLFFDQGWPTAQRNLTDSLLKILIETGADGIDLNFEGVSKEHKDRFISFIKDLSFELREMNNEYTISMSVPFYNEDGVYDLKKLSPWVDLFVINGFNGHITKTTLEMGAIAPLHEDKTSIRGTNLVYTPSTNLYDLLQISKVYAVDHIYLLHTDEYTSQLVKKLERYISQSNIDLDVLYYKSGDLTKLMEIIGASADLLANPEIVNLLKKTNCEADVYRSFAADVSSDFFLFGMNWDTLSITEKDMFEYDNFYFYGSTNNENKDGIGDALNRYVEDLGEEYKTSLVMGLPYHGAVWMDKDPTDKGDEEFYGYMSYGQIRRLITERNQDSIRLVDLYYDKSQHTMILQVLDTITERSIIDSFLREGDKYYTVLEDTIWPGTLIYFDNSSTLERKFDYSLKQGIGGVAVWALGYDHTYKDLWRTIENTVVNRWEWNPEKQRVERFKIAKNNKVSFTIQYQVKRMSTLTLATLFLIAIFMFIAFSFSLLDWKVRDALFYSGAFRLFYLTLFALILLSFGSYVGLFRNEWGTYFVGLFLGAALVWIASLLVRRDQAKLP
ncbi:MAG: glycosyl hydrolase family 18 protein [Saprospiraceae bacterium]|nr:glycosyl hydrolase family 18 protein [Saprospiraceae bacterium]